MARGPEHVCVILDEAYCEFALRSATRTRRSNCCGATPNLVLLRTFSKVYGLCGLRVGYALCGSEDFGPPSTRCASRSICNAAAQAAAVEALRHQDEVERRVVHTIVGPPRSSTDGLRELGIGPAESHANFFWFHLPVAEARTRRSRPASSAGWASAACSCARAPRSGAPARCA